MALLHSTMAILHFTLFYRGSTSLYFTIYITLPWLYLWLIVILLDSTLLYHGSILLYLIDSTLLYHGSTSHFFTLYYSTMAVLDSTWLYITIRLPWLFLTLLNPALLYDGSPSFYFTLHVSTMTLYFTILHSTITYHGLCFTLLRSTWLY